MCTTQDLVHQTARLRAFNLTSASAVAAATTTVASITPARKP
jgi:hypothetical protein